MVGYEPAVNKHLTLWYIVLVCHHNDVCENSIGGVYVGGYDGQSESGIGCWRKLCPVGFLVVSKCSSDLLQCIIMWYADCGVDG